MTGACWAMPATRQPHPCIGTALLLSSICPFFPIRIVTLLLNGARACLGHILPGTECGLYAVWLGGLACLPYKVVRAQGTDTSSLGPSNLQAAGASLNGPSAPVTQDLWTSGQREEQEAWFCLPARTSEGGRGMCGQQYLKPPSLQSIRVLSPCVRA